MVGAPRFELGTSWPKAVTATSGTPFSLIFYWKTKDLFENLVVAGSTNT
jgi:hypothetical protein